MSPGQAKVPGLFTNRVWFGDEALAGAVVADDLLTSAPLRDQRRCQSGTALRGPTASRSGRFRRSPKPFVGRTIRALPCKTRCRDIAWRATLYAAVIRTRSRAARRSPLSLRVADWQLNQRVIRVGRLLLFVVDASGSMGGRQIALAKRLACQILKTAYVLRERIAMIAFRGREARLIFGPTSRLAVVEQQLRCLSAGGATPLPDALSLAATVIRRQRLRRDDNRTVVLLISDGQANVCRGPSNDVMAAVRRSADALRCLSGVESLLLDTTACGENDQSARTLAGALGGRHLKLTELARRGIDPCRYVARLLHQQAAGPTQTDEV